MQALRERAGVPEPVLSSHELPYDRTLGLCQAPPSLEAWPPGWTSHTSHPLRPEAYSTGDPEPWLDDLPRDRPIVAVTLGTLFGSPTVYEAVVRGALAAGARVIASAAGRLDVDDDRLMTVPWVSMDRLTAAADAVVHHAGWGSTIAAVTAGVPAVVVPLGADQPATAARLHSTGAAIAVGPGPDLETAAGSAVGRVLEDSVFRLNTARLREEIEAMPAAPAVVPLVEELAATGGPVLNRPRDRCPEPSSLVESSDRSSASGERDRPGGRRIPPPAV
jgi:UDP:flavonoid glycosyltransferase YjiC (YdhE family)